MTYVSAEDVSAVAFHALTDATAPPHDYLIVGPERLTHDEVGKLPVIIPAAYPIPQGHLKPGHLALYEKRLSRPTHPIFPR